jgi:hypothetical protein
VYKWHCVQCCYLYSVEPVRLHFPPKQPYCTNDTVCNAAIPAVLKRLIVGHTCPAGHERVKMSINSLYIKHGRWTEFDIPCFQSQIMLCKKMFEYSYVLVMQSKSCTIHTLKHTHFNT